MKITFVECEPAERLFFERELLGHKPAFVDSINDVDEDAEIVCVFIYSQVDAAFLLRHPHVHAIVTRSTTTDHIDLEECARRSIKVVKVESYGDHAVAEHTFALLLALTRRLWHVARMERRGFSFTALRGSELWGKTLGILGLGRIGQEVAPIAKGFGMKLLAHDLPAMASAAGNLGIPFVGLRELLARSDIVTLHLALTPQTLHILNRQTLAECRPGVLIINTARGALIDSVALAEALDSGQVGGVGLDVLEDERVMRTPATKLLSHEIVERLKNPFLPIEHASPTRSRRLYELMQSEALLARPNVVFTPHIGFNSEEAMSRVNRETLADIRACASALPRDLPSPVSQTKRPDVSYAAAGFR